MGSAGRSEEIADRATFADASPGVGRTGSWASRHSGRASRVSAKAAAPASAAETSSTTSSLGEGDSEAAVDMRRDSSCSKDERAVCASSLASSAIGHSCLGYALSSRDVMSVESAWCAAVVDEVFDARHALTFVWWERFCYACVPLYEQRLQIAEAARRELPSAKPLLSDFTRASASFSFTSTSITNFHPTSSHRSHTRCKTGRRCVQPQPSPATEVYSRIARRERVPRVQWPRSGHMP